MFDYFVSLGPTCPIASSMSKYGLRTFSGPFDWLVTEDFSWVLRFIESNFDGFLHRKNLERYSEKQEQKQKQKQFVDKSCGFIFLHEAEDFEYDFSALKRKYSRRINRFIELSSKKICYLRFVVNQQELEYIKNNKHYIQSIIKKNNTESEIVFLIKNDLLIPDGFPFRCYYAPGVYSYDSRHLLRSWFDGATDFLEFCGHNYSGISMLKNIALDHEKEDRIHEIHELNNRRYITLTTLLEYDFAKAVLPERIIIYGAGVLGQNLYTKIYNFTKVDCFIDRDKGGAEFQGVPIISLSDFRNSYGATIVVSTAYDFELIKTKIFEDIGETPIISIDEILGLDF